MNFRSNEYSNKYNFGHMIIRANVNFDKWFFGQMIFEQMYVLAKACIKYNFWKETFLLSARSENVISAKFW